MTKADDEMGEALAGCGCLFVLSVLAALGLVVVYFGVRTVMACI